MANIFISGSKTAKTDESVRAKIKEWMALGHHFLIGDCKGIDTEMQHFLADNGYRKVTVCYSRIPSSDKNLCRNLDSRADSLGWNVKGIDTHAQPYTRAFYTSKDEDMTYACDIALVIWDGVSAGSKANIDRAAANGKKVLVRVNNRWHAYNAN